MPPTDSITKIISPTDVANKKPKLEIRNKPFTGTFSKPDGGRVDVTAKLAERVKDDGIGDS